MLFSDIYSLLPTSLTDTQKVEVLQVAYEFVIKKLRLDPTVLPIFMSGQRVKTLGFEYMNNIITTESEVAIKEIKTFFNETITNPLDEDRYALGTWTIGDTTVAGFGFNATAFAAVNDDQSTRPTFYWSGTDVTCTNLDPSFFLIECFVYPYFCMHTTDDQFTVEHRYDIQWMIDTYTEELLEIDDLVGILSALKALSLWFGEQGDINFENIFDKATLDIINMYNEFNSLKYSDSYEKIGNIEAHLA